MSLTDRKLIVCKKHDTWMLISVNDIKKYYCWICGHELEMPNTRT